VRSGCSRCSSGWCSGLAARGRVIALITTLIGWLTDAILDYRRVVEAESTGHIENGPPPATPRRLFTVLIVLIVGAAVLQSGCSRRIRRPCRRSDGVRLARCAASGLGSGRVRATRVGAPAGSP